MKKRDIEVQESSSSFSPQPSFVGTCKHYIEADSKLMCDLLK